MIERGYCRSREYVQALRDSGVSGSPVLRVGQAIRYNAIDSSGFGLLAPAELKSAFQRTSQTQRFQHVCARVSTANLSQQQPF